MEITQAKNQQEWDSFLSSQRFRPFLQSWTMGEVYGDIGQEPIRLEARSGDSIEGICQGIVVPARRGRHVMVQYGPVLRSDDALQPLLKALEEKARERQCSFIRISPFWEEQNPLQMELAKEGALPSPLHLLSEYTWYIPLKKSDRWAVHSPNPNPNPSTTGERGSGEESATGAITEEELLAQMRKTTRNLIRRAEKDGVTVRTSDNPNADLDIYFALQEETYRRHKFVPYRESFIRAQVKRFAAERQALVYIARYNDEPIAASVHMRFGGETSYHHGASTHKYDKIPASYLLQWTAIREALKRGDEIYNFWGIAPPLDPENPSMPKNKNHPFAGVSMFKTGFGGRPMPLLHCMDIPLTSSYTFTRAFETVRKWKRGF